MSLRASTASKSTKGLSVSLYFASPSRRHYEGNAVRPARCRPICPTLCQFQFPTAQGISAIATQAIRVQYNVSFGDIERHFCHPLHREKSCGLNRSPLKPKYQHPKTAPQGSAYFQALRHTHNRHVDPFSCVWRGSSLLPAPSS